MFGIANKRYFGLDIGDSAIKLIEIKKTREGFRLGSARLIRLNLDPLFDDSEKRNSVIKENLNKLFTEQGIHSGIVALAISGQSVFVRPLKIPKIAKSKVEQIIQYEAQLQVPFPINEVIWNYEISEIYDSAEAEVTLVAVKKDIVEEKLKLLRDTALEVDFVEVDSFALFNALEFINGIKNKIIIDIGAKITDIIIAEEHKVWTRSILIGGNDLTKAIAANLKIGFKEAEELKIKEGIVAISEEERNASPRAASISDAISPVMVEFLTDLSKSIGYYKSQFGETKIFKEILITGGCSKLKNLPRFIRDNIDLPAREFSRQNGCRRRISAKNRYPAYDQDKPASQGDAAGEGIREEEVVCLRFPVDRNVHFYDGDGLCKLV
jgi:type IV pilus assembly protein PilM